MPHIHTGPGEHDATVSALIIRFDTPEPQVLFHTHKKFHKLMQPGGHVELRETPWQAILHEIVEETGYTLDQLSVLQPKQRIRHVSKTVLHPVPLCENSYDVGDSHWHTDRIYVFAADDIPHGIPAAGESTDMKWLTASELAALTDKQTFTDIRDIASYALQVCVTEWERVGLDNYAA